MEIWKDVPGYEGRYMASSDGRVKSIKNGRELILKPSTGSSRYPSVRLIRNSLMVHRVIAITFCPNPENKKFVNHKNGIKTDARAENLEWVTFQENMDHGYANGLMHKHKGPTHHFAKLNKNDVFNIRFNRNQFKIPFSVIAEFYGVSSQSIIHIIQGKNWAHI